MFRFHRALPLAAAALTATMLFMAACKGSTSHAALGTPTTGTPPSTPSSSAGTSSSPAESPLKTEKPVPAESNPPGDIPDTTQFVPYRSSNGHFEVKVPEGWSRRTSGSSVSFTSKLNSVELTWSSASPAPSVTSVQSNQVPQLQSSERAFTLGKVLDCSPACNIPYSTAPIDVHLQTDAVVATYHVNSAPNPVTGKQYRLEVIRFDFYRSGEEADLILSGPVGSDNVDPWRLVAESFKWI